MFDNLRFGNFDHLTILTHLRLLNSATSILIARPPQCWLIRPILVQCSIITPKFIVEETSSYWSVTRLSVFLNFSLINQRHTSAITVYNRTETNIENTVRAVYSRNSWLIGCYLLSFPYKCYKLYANRIDSD